MNNNQIIIDMRNFDMLDNAVKQYKFGNYDSIEIKCFNHDEAKHYQEYMANKYPNIPFYSTWLDWD